ncbi:hypothetical protein BDV23DRAFT_185523 [Aspergillus alliaceus]|uniref:Myb-like DNA-binding domain-containing protein n=1 Tax=Petromyces alliaceus TaxID=209559 RepID=A0A5N7C369_PETAA|nr:hypothetical protein BDV23DRAFT_185523 [Aspergillus alliaceus]
MSRITDNGQLDFLLSCIRHSNSGKVDFEEVAKECSIVTKGAAAKRYERLVKGRNSTSHGASSTNSPVSSPKKTNKSSVTKRKAVPKAAVPKRAGSKNEKVKAMKVIAVAYAESLLKHMADPDKVEGQSSGEETEIDEEGPGVSDTALFDQFCYTDDGNGYVQVKGEDSDADA